MRGARALFLWAVLALAGAVPARAQAPYGLASRPAVGAYFDGAFPKTPPVLGDWSTVDAFPNLSFLNPMGIVQVPNRNQMLVFEREGRVYLIDHSPAAATKKLALDISNQCQGWDDCGLLNVLFHPKFDLGGAAGTNRWVFLYYQWVPPGTVQGSATERPPVYIAGVRDRLSRFTLDANGVAVSGSEVVILENAASVLWHNGGGMFFHPATGYLHLGVGDDTNLSNAQQIDRPLLSGVLRIDVDQRGGSMSHAPVRVPPGCTAQNYFIPNDNPLVGQPGVNEEFIAIGLRNPHRMTFDAPSGRTFIGDVGAGEYEEVNIIEASETACLNFQWYRLEGNTGDLVPPFIGVDKRPALDYAHSEGQAIIGGQVYRGAAFPELAGKYLFCDNVSGKVWAMNEGTTPATKSLLTIVGIGAGPNTGYSYVGISSWGVDAAGEVYLCRLSSTEGKILKLQRGGSAPTSPLPTTLSGTGLFSNVPALTPSAKLIPYSLNAPFWSDKALKSRWMAVPSGKTVGFAPTGEWSFPEGTVAVKHFAYGVDDTNPAIKRPLETRVLVQMAAGGVYGATYKWRADGSDADLINDPITENIAIVTEAFGTLTGQDIGSPNRAGSTSRSGTTLTVSGSGTGIAGRSDQFRFAHQQRTGDFDVQVKVTSLTDTYLYTKVGLMARATLAADAAHVCASAYPSNAQRGNNQGGYEMHFRAEAGGETVSLYPAAPHPRVVYPETWLRLRRTGQTFISYSSVNGANWTEFARQTQTLPATVYFGLAITSHDVSKTATAVVQLSATRLQPWYYPGRTDCVTCHTTNSGGFLGPKTRQLNADQLYPSTGVTDNQLRAWNHVGLFNSPVDEASIPGFDKLAHVDQTSETLEKRVRSYLDTNCASCHRPGGVPAYWDARFDTPLASQGIIFGAVGHSLDMANARVVVPQDTSRSMMHYRMNRVGPNQMPPMARNLVDEAGVQLLADWIAAMPLNQPPSVTLNAPSSVVLPNPVHLSAAASDPEGVAKVEFYANGTKIGENNAAPYSLKWEMLLPGQYQVTARAVDQAGNEAFSSARTVQLVQVAENGLVAQHWAASDFTDLKVTRIEGTVDFNYGQGSPASSIGPDGFSSRWTGSVVARAAGVYTFTVASGEPVQLWVNGSLLVSAASEQTPRTRSGTISLGAGQAYDLRLEHVELTGLSAIQLRWSGPGFSEELIPASAFRLPASSSVEGLLSGTVIGTAGSYENSSSATRAAAFDGLFSTFFDAPNPDGAWVGLDAGVSGRTISRIRYAPRSTFSGRMVGGLFQGANTADFSDAATLFTVSAMPPDGALTSRIISHPAGFRYVRYLSPPSGWGNVAELEFYSLLIPAPAAPVGLAAVPGNQRVALTWDASPRASLYRIKRGTTPGGPYADLTETAGLSYVDVSAVNGTTYYYVVCATNAGGEGLASDTAIATPESPPIGAAEMAAPSISRRASNMVLTVSTTEIGHSYQLQYSDSLAPESWQNLGVPAAGTGAPLEIEIAASPSVPMRFFRIVISR
jgi:glucose/arabinose dehydrogenase/mono/diheme cytochrome c family protein